MNKSLIIAAIISATVSFQASANQCLIYLNLPCRAAGPNPYFAPLRTFKDVDVLANLNAARCMERAQEYKSWCGVPHLEAASTFESEGHYVIGASTGADGKTYIHNGYGRWTAFSK